MSLGLQIVGIIVGLLNLFLGARYFVIAWQSLTAQGLTHTYLAIVSVLSCWWLALIIGICFMASVTPDPEKSRAKQVGAFLLRLVVSTIAPQLMLGAWVFLVVAIRELLF